MHPFYVSNHSKTVIFDKAVNFLYTVSKNLYIDQLRSKKVALKFEKSVIQQIESYIDKTG